MARIVLGAVGAMIGSTFGPQGAQIGWSIGSAIGGTFEPNQKSAGPRLEDLTAGSSSYGSTIPYIAGSPRVPGQIIWASAKRETAHTETSGKGGGGGQEYTSYTYDIDLLLLLSDNQIGGVTRIWSNGELVWSGLGSLESQIASGATTFWARMTSYTGGPSQLPDPTYEAAVGGANAPAYRGRGTVFIQGLQLGNTGQIPNLTFEIGSVKYGQVVCLQHFEDISVPPQYFSPDVPYGSGNTNTASVRYLDINTGVGPNWNINAGSIGAGVYNNAVLIRSPSLKGYNSYHQGYVAHIIGANSVVYGTAWTNLTSNMVIGAGEDFIIEFIHDPVTNYPIPGTTNEVFRYNSDLFGSSSTGCCLQISGTNYATVNNYYTGSGRGYQFSSIGIGLNGGNTPLNTPIRVCISRVGNTASIYYNGIRKATLTSTGVFNSVIGEVGGFLNLGSSGPGGYCYSTNCPGVYDEFIIVRGAGISAATYVTATNQYADSGIFPVASIIPPTLKSVVDSLCTQSGLSISEYDTTALTAITEPVNSLAITQVSNIRNTLELLAQAYNFDMIASDKLYFRLKGQASVQAIPLTDIGVGNNETLTIHLASEVETPTELSLTYSNIEDDYQLDTQYSQRIEVDQINTSVLQMPLGFIKSRAKIIADIILLEKVLSMTNSVIRVQDKYAKLEPTDVITVEDDLNTYWRFKIVKKILSAEGTSFTLTLDDSSIYTQAGITSTENRSQTVVYAPPFTELRLLDIPMLRDADNSAGHYVAVSGSSSKWENAGIYKSTADSNYVLNQVMLTDTAIGSCDGILGNFTIGSIFDEINTLTVYISSDNVLTSSTRDNILANKYTNLALVGAELIQFRAATLVTPGKYTISGLLRGRFGTESSIPTHVQRESFCLLGSGGMGFVSIPAGTLGTKLFYKAVSPRQLLSSVQYQNITPTGLLLKPLSPVDLRVNRISTSTVFTWKRRTRVSTRFSSSLGISVPLGEDVEKYTVEFYSDNTFTTLKRTYTDLLTPTVTYTSANQITDFGSNQSDFFIKVYQMSSTIGKGTPITASLEKPTEPDIIWRTSSTSALSNNNTTFSGSILAWAKSDVVSSGKRYFEVTKVGTPTIGICEPGCDLSTGSPASHGTLRSAWFRVSSGSYDYFVNNTFMTSGTGFLADNSKIGVAIDFDIGVFWAIYNGTALFGNPVAGTGGYSFGTGRLMCPAVLVNSGSTTISKFSSNPNNVKYPIAGFTSFLI